MGERWGKMGEAGWKRGFGHAKPVHVGFRAHLAQAFILLQYLACEVPRAALFAPICRGQDTTFLGWRWVAEFIP